MDPLWHHRYPRSLAEAFPFGPEYGAALSGPYRRPTTATHSALALACIALALLLIACAAAFIDARPNSNNKKQDSQTPQTFMRPVPGAAQGESNDALRKNSGSQT